MFWQQLLNSILDTLPSLGFLLLLHFLRNAIGNHALHILMGVFLILSLTSGLPFFLDGYLNPAEALGLGYGSLTISVFTTLLMIYEIHGTRETQRVLLGLILTLLALGLFSSLSVNTYYSIMMDIASLQDRLLGFMEILRRGTFIFIVSNLIFCLALPVVFQSLRNWHVPFFFASFVCNGIIIASRLSDTGISLRQLPRKEVILLFFMRFVVAAVISGIVTIYVKMTKGNSYEPKKSFGIFSNIFLHLQSTEKLRQAMAEWQEKYQAVLNHCSEFIFILDADGFILNANLAAYRILGNDISRHRRISDFITDAHHAPFILPSLLLTAISGDSTLTKPYSAHNMILGSPTTDTPLEIDFNLTNAAVEGEPVYLLIAHDMTEIHANQRRERELQEQLFHSQRLESLGILAGGIAHDFNNMLHSVQGNTELLRQLALPPAASSMLESLEDATHRASQLVAQLLGFARKGNLNLKTISLDSLLSQTALLFKPSARNIAFKILMEPGRLMVVADAVQLQQVLLNLLINARDALASAPDTQMPKIVLRAETLRACTHEWLQSPIPDVNPAKYVCIKVKDNGPGIPSDVLPHIFEPFFTTKPMGKGTGMGLAMAYGCITNLNGWIDVVSSPEKGTEFTIVLPLADADSPAFKKTVTD